MLITMVSVSFAQNISVIDANDYSLKKGDFERIERNPSGYDLYQDTLYTHPKTIVMLDSDQCESCASKRKGFTQYANEAGLTDIHFTVLEFHKNNKRPERPIEDLWQNGYREFVIFFDGEGIPHKSVVALFNEQQNQVMRAEYNAVADSLRNQQSFTGGEYALPYSQEIVCLDELKKVENIVNLSKELSYGDKNYKKKVWEPIAYLEVSCAAKLLNNLADGYDFRSE